MNELAAKGNNAATHRANLGRDSLPELIIFDCDGVLVQSEEITLTVLASMLNLQFSAYPNVTSYFEPSVCIEQFRGRKIGDCLLEVEQLSGVKLDSSFESKFRERSFEALSSQLKPTEGIVEVLRGLRIPYCVASSAPRKKIEHCLSVTGLLPYFEGSIFSCYELNAWKPDPKVFLEACKHYKVKASEALVVEDSVVGIQAAVAAQIRVLGFGPIDRHLLLENAGALPFANMHDLLVFLSWQNI